MLWSMLQVFGAVPGDQSIGFPQGSGGQSANVRLLGTFSCQKNLCSECVCVGMVYALPVFLSLSAWIQIIQQKEVTSKNNR